MSGTTMYYTKAGLQALKDKLKGLEEKKPEAIAEVAMARSKGDLKENAGYHAAREHLALLETRIQQLKHKISNAHLINAEDINTNIVSILTNVTLKNLHQNQEVRYQLVSDDEANIKEKKISVSSPIAKGILGKKKGDITTVKTPGGSIKFEIIDITF